jgi:S13-like protein
LLLYDLYLSNPSICYFRRMEGLKLACAARSIRRQIKESLNDGSISLSELIRLGKRDKIINRMKMYDLILTLPGVGEVKARSIMVACGISPARRLRGLGWKQAEKLEEAIRYI